MYKFATFLVTALFSLTVFAEDNIWKMVDSENIKDRINQAACKVTVRFNNDKAPYGIDEKETRWEFNVDLIDGYGSHEGSIALPKVDGEPNSMLLQFTFWTSSYAGGAKKSDLHYAAAAVLGERKSENKVQIYGEDDFSFNPSDSAFYQVAGYSSEGITITNSKLTDLIYNLHLLDDVSVSKQQSTIDEAYVKKSMEVDGLKKKEWTTVSVNCDLLFVPREKK